MSSPFPSEYRRSVSCSTSTSTSTSTSSSYHLPRLRRAATAAATALFVLFVTSSPSPASANAQVTNRHDEKKLVVPHVDTPGPLFVSIADAAALQTLLVDTRRRPDVVDNSGHLSSSIMLTLTGTGTETAKESEKDPTSGRLGRRAQDQKINGGDDGDSGDSNGSDDNDGGEMKVDPMSSMVITVSLDEDGQVIAATDDLPGPTSSSSHPAEKTVARPTSTPAGSQPSALPSFFDSAIADEFTSNEGLSCPQFINSMLNDSTFKSCYPLSLLIQTSQSLFDAAKQLFTLVSVLDVSCAADPQVCSTYLNAQARALIEPANCAEEFRADNSIVRQAYDGLHAYQIVFSATCLRDPDTSMYCYADAMTNLTAPYDAYLYFLPYNMTLPSGTSPTCGWCVQRTMGIFQAAAADRAQLVAGTYVGAAANINAACGVGFVADTLPEEVESEAASSFSSLVSPLPFPLAFDTRGLKGLVTVIVVAGTTILGCFIF